MAEIDACNGVIESLNNPDKSPVTTYQRISSLEITDVDKEVDQLVKELEESGINQIIDEANRQLEEWRKSQ